MRHEETSSKNSMACAFPYLRVISSTAYHSDGSHAWLLMPCRQGVCATIVVAQGPGPHWQWQWNQPSLGTQRTDCSTHSCARRKSGSCFCLTAGVAASAAFPLGSSNLKNQDPLSMGMNDQESAARRCPPSMALSMESRSTL